MCPDVAFAPVAHKDFAAFQVHAAWRIIVFDDGIDKERVSFFGPVAAEGGGVCQFVDSAVHCLGARLWKGQGDISCTQPDKVGFGMGHLEQVDFLFQVGEEVVVRQFQEMFVYQCHIRYVLKFMR